MYDNLQYGLVAATGGVYEVQTSGQIQVKLMLTGRHVVVAQAATGNVI